MAKALMLWPSGTGVRIGSTEAARLAALGVTNVCLLRDGDSVAGGLGQPAQLLHGVSRAEGVAEQR